METVVLVWVLMLGTGNNSSRLESGSGTFSSTEACLRAEKRMLTNIVTFNNEPGNRYKPITVISIGCDGTIIDPVKQRK